MNKQKPKISEEVALKELETFIHNHVRKAATGEDLKNQYPNIFDAILNGNLIIDGETITYKLEKPVLNDEKVPTLEKVNFKTRIKPSDQARLGRGIDLQKDSANYALILVSYIIDQPKAMLDKFHKWDYATINEIAAVFM